MDTFGAQLIVLFCLLFGNFLFGGIPSFISKVVGLHSDSEENWERKLKWTSFLLYIGAGIFISNSFIVLLPQANNEFDTPENHSHGIPHLQSPPGGHSDDKHNSFPIPEFAVLCGFFLTFVMQETVYFLLSKCNKSARDARDLKVRFCSCAKRHTECSRTFKDVRPDQTLFGLEKKLLESGSVPCSASDVLPEAKVTSKSELLRSSIIPQTIPNYGAVTNVTEPPIDSLLPVLTPPDLLDDERRLIVEEHDTTKDQNKFLISSILVVAELSLQYIFSGIRLGLQIQHSRKLSYLTVACVQNFFLTFSAGSYLAAGNMEFPYVGLFIGLLSTVSPIGIIAAMVNNSVQEIPHLTKGIVSSVACGALLYTTFYEFLRKKRSGSVTGLTKFVAITLGASLMIALQYGILTL